jgi:asparagine synthase (glutamine-hydrolysing)
MCGIAGFWGDGYNHNEASVILSEMGSSIAHRGPDDSGVFFDERSGLGLAHRRLSILDLSSSGSQPMVSKDDRYVIVFNGEIYNHLEIRKELDAASANPNQWKGYSDTETILAGFLFWGVRSTLTRLVGMFAIALWDKQSWTLTLIRDRVGEKPLYYGIQNKCLVFGSELKALKKHSKFDGDIDRESLALYFKRGFIPAPYSIYKGVFKLPQASLLEINLSDVESKVLGQPELYWSLENTIIDGHIRPLSGSFERNSTTLESTLLRSVTQQQISDVPVGAFLSGGIDSSLIAALMQSQSSIPVSTFTIGFEDADFNEANQAKVIAKKLGTSHNELYMPPSEGLKVIPQLPHLYDEPFADPSQLPMILLAEMTKRHVTVALSGDGGDELFG